MPTAIDESLTQDQIDDIEEEEKYYLGKLYNAFYIQMEACCTVITLLSVHGRISGTRFVSIGVLTH